MYESTITHPAFDERRWPLRGPRGAVVAVALLSGGFAAYMLWGAIVDQQPFVYGGTVFFDVAGMSAIIAVLGCLMLLVAVQCTIAAFRMVGEGRSMVLGDMFVEAPASAMSKQLVRIPYTELRIKVTEASYTALELRGADNAKIRVATLNFASDAEWQDCLIELRRRLAEIEEARVW